MNKFIISTVLLLVFSGCKKYEEDDYWFTLKSPKKRLLGLKTMSEYTVDGIDSLSFFKNKFGDFVLEFEPDGNINILNINTLEILDKGNWKFDPNRKPVNFGLTLSQNFYESYGFTIVKLTSSNIFLERNGNNINPAQFLNGSMIHNIKLKFKKYE